MHLIKNNLIRMSNPPEPRQERQPSNNQQRKLIIPLALHSRLRVLLQDIQIQVRLAIGLRRIRSILVGIGIVAAFALADGGW